MESLLCANLRILSQGQVCTGPEMQFAALSGMEVAPLQTVAAKQREPEVPGANSPAGQQTSVISFLEKHKCSFLFQQFYGRSAGLSGRAPGSLLSLPIW